ncbi:MAG: nickel-responsive transcriptional regulator NikR [Betaproteobacteria bacterium]|nr:nickel-responsive transcriptional regulator NikR [Betaproteobacteria bacterium]
MQRFTLSIDDFLAGQFDGWLRRKGYDSRSEAFRDLVRRALDEEGVHPDASAQCVACLSFVYHHHERQLAGRIAELQHAHHEITVSTIHVHLDQEACLEAAILRGPVAAVRALADAITAQKAVRHGQLNLVSAEAERPAAPPHHHPHS